MHEYGKRKEKGSNVMNSKKRMLAGALCLATIGFGSTVSAASVDPFSPVPLESGLYEEVAALIHDGLIYGYSDSTFDKSHMISRYEMAIFVGKANASYSKANAADKARIKRLVDQFSDELKGMGVNTAKTLGTSATEASAEEAEPQTSVYNADDEDTGFTMNPTARDCRCPARCSCSGTTTKHVSRITMDIKQAARHRFPRNTNQMRAIRTSMSS